MPRPIWQLCNPNFSTKQQAVGFWGKQIINFKIADALKGKKKKDWHKQKEEWGQWNFLNFVFFFN